MNTNGDGDSADIYGVNWQSQFFLVGNESHTITSVKLQLKRTGSPSTVTVSIKHATAGGLPTGLDIVSTTLDGDALTTSYTWYNIELDETLLQADTGYCIVVRAEAGDTDNDINWKKDTAGDGDTTNDFAVESTDGGLTWAAEGSDADYLFEVWGNTCIDTVSAVVYRNYLEDGDMLFLMLYKNIYVPYYSASNPANYFNVQLLGTDGLTVLASTPCKQWEYMPASIYLNADSASNLDAGSQYYMRVYGTFSPNPEAYYQLQVADWLPENEIYLEDWVLLTAHQMEDWYTDYLDSATVLTTYLNNVEVLNNAGGTAFAIGIPYLTTQFPQLFYDVDYAFDPDFTITGEDNYTALESWQTLVGADMTALAEDMGDIFGGIDGKAVILIAILIIYVIVAIVVVGANKDYVTYAFALAFPFIGFAGYLRVLDIAALVIIASIALFVTVYSWYLTRM
jgi:hypothetical protein